MDSPRAVLLVEGISDRAAVQALARRHGRDLAAEGIAVVPTGGYGNLERFLREYGPSGFDVPIAGLYDAGEVRHVRRALERAGFGTPADLETIGFYACDDDLEDELTRAVGPTEMEDVLAAQDELKKFRTYQRQPAHRDRPLAEQVHGFMWNRKGRYAVVLVEVLPLDRIPRPLEAVLDYVRAIRTSS